MREYADVKTGLSGESYSFGQTEKTEAEETTGQRNARTIRDELEYDRRWIFPRTWTKATIHDRKDNLFLANASVSDSDALQQHVFAHNRKVDVTLIDAIMGINQTGAKGHIPVALPSSNFISASIGASAATGMNLAKIMEARTFLEENEAWLADGGDTAVMFISPKMKQELLNDPRLTSIETSQVKALIEGALNYFYGFRIVTMNGLPKNESGQTQALCYMKSGLRVGVWEDRITKVSELPENSYSRQIYTEQSLGATRVEEKKFVILPCV